MNQKLTRCLLMALPLYVEIRGKSKRKKGTLFRVKPTYEWIQGDDTFNGALKFIVPLLVVPEDFTLESMWVTCKNGDVYEDVYMFDCKAQSCRTNDTLTLTYSAGVYLPKVDKFNLSRLLCSPAPSGFWGYERSSL